MNTHIIAAAAAALVAASPAAHAQVASPGAVGIAYIDGVATTSDPLINQAAASRAQGASAVVTTNISTQPVIIQGGVVVSAQQPLDMELTPVPGTKFAFMNASGQVVMVVPNNRSIAVVSR